MSSNDEIVGAIFPLPGELISRIFDEGRTVFVKVPTVYKDLRPGSKILFYASGDVRAIVGEGTAEAVEMLEPEEAVKKYGRRLMLNREELAAYVRGKPRAKKLLVIPLRGLRRYSKPYRPKRFVTVAGERLTKKRYEEIVRQAGI